LNKEQNYVSYKTPRKHTKKKRVITQRHINPPLIKEFKRFFIGGLCGLPLEVGHVDDLWLITTHP